MTIDPPDGSPQANSWTEAGTGPGRAGLAASYARHVGSLRGALRHALVSRALFAHLPDRPQRILDVGGGTGHQALVLAHAGHLVHLLDPDPQMLARARLAIDSESSEVRARIRLTEGTGEEAAELVDHGHYDLVTCHGVLMYLADPAPLLSTLVAGVHPGGLVSVLAKNASALAMRPGMEGRWSDALDTLRTTGNPGPHAPETGGLGVASRGDTVPAVEAAILAQGAEMVAWYGVRVFTDHLRDAPVGADFDRIVDLEWEAGRQDPYRQVARLFHLIARRSIP
jgi:S-adenosylmethionine-dependent methyltransferase